MLDPAQDENFHSTALIPQAGGPATRDILTNLRDTLWATVTAPHIPVPIFICCTYFSTSIQTVLTDTGGFTTQPVSTRQRTPPCQWFSRLLSLSYCHPLFNSRSQLMRSRNQAGVTPNNIYITWVRLTRYSTGECQLRLFVPLSYYKHSLAVSW